MTHSCKRPYQLTLGGAGAAAVPVVLTRECKLFGLVTSQRRLLGVESETVLCPANARALYYCTLNPSITAWSIKTVVVESVANKRNATVTDARHYRRAGWHQPEWRPVGRQH